MIQEHIYLIVSAGTFVLGSAAYYFLLKKKNRLNNVIKKKLDNLVGRNKQVSEKFSKISSEELINILEDKIARYENENLQLTSSNLQLHNEINRLNQANNKVSDFVNKINRNAASFVKTYKLEEVSDQNILSSLQKFEIDFNQAIIKHNKFYKSLQELLIKVNTSIENLDEFKSTKLANQSTITVSAEKIGHRLQSFHTLFNNQNTNLVESLNILKNLNEKNKGQLDKHLQPIYDQIEKNSQEIHALRKSIQKQGGIDNALRSVDLLSKVIQDHKSSNPALAVNLLMHLEDVKSELTSSAETQHQAVNQLIELEKEQKHSLPILQKEFAKILITENDKNVTRLKDAVSGAIMRNENIFELLQELGKRSDSINELLQVEWKNLEQESLRTSEFKTQMYLVKNLIEKLNFDPDLQTSDEIINTSGFRVNEKGEIII